LDIAAGDLFTPVPTQTWQAWTEAFEIGDVDTEQVHTPPPPHIAFSQQTPSVATVQSVYCRTYSSYPYYTERRRLVRLKTLYSRRK
jgi:hypothetical protein